MREQVELRFDPAPGTAPAPDAERTMRLLIYLPAAAEKAQRASPIVVGLNFSTTLARNGAMGRTGPSVRGDGQLSGVRHGETSVRVQAFPPSMQRPGFCVDVVQASLFHFVQNPSCRLMLLLGTGQTRPKALGQGL